MLDKNGVPMSSASSALSAATVFSAFQAPFCNPAAANSGHNSTMTDPRLQPQNSAGVQSGISAQQM